MTNKALAKLMMKYKKKYAFYLVDKFGDKAISINAQRIHVYMESFIWNKKGGIKC